MEHAIAACSSSVISWIAFRGASGASTFCSDRCFLVFLVHSELDCVRSGFGAQVVHACFQALFPSVEMHGGQFRRVDVFHEDIQGLRLADECSAIRGHVNQGPLGNFPSRAIQRLQVVREFH